MPVTGSGHVWAADRRGSQVQVHGTGAVKQGPLRQGSPQGVHDASIGRLVDPVVELEWVLIKVKELGLAGLAAEQELVMGRADHVLACSRPLGKDQVPHWCRPVQIRPFHTPRYRTTPV